MRNSIKLEFETKPVRPASGLHPVVGEVDGRGSVLLERVGVLEVQIDLSKVTAPYVNSPSTLLGMSGVQKEKTEPGSF